MAKYPLIFSFHDVIVGTGFIAGVACRGRVRMVEDGEEVWMHGVTPGGLAGGGPDRGAASYDFKQGYLSVLYDLASEAKNLADFRDRVRGFVLETSSTEQVEWLAAVAAVREGALSLDLPRESAEEPVGVEVIELEQRTAHPDVNTFDRITLAAA